MSDQPIWGARSFRCPHCEEVHEHRWDKVNRPSQLGVWAEMSVCRGCGHKMVWRVAFTEDSSGTRGKLVFPRP